MKTFQEKEIEAFDEKCFYQKEWKYTSVDIKNWVKEHDKRLLEEIEKRLPKIPKEMELEEAGGAIWALNNVREILKSFGTLDHTR